MIIRNKTGDPARLPSVNITSNVRVTTGMSGSAIRIELPDTKPASASANSAKVT